MGKGAVGKKGQGTVGNRIWDKYRGENDGVRGLWGKGYGTNTVARMMGSADCGEREAGRGP